MKAILLAAGVGKRMGPDAGPKCLISIGGKSLLRMTLEFLKAAGIRKVVLVVGHRKEEVRQEAVSSAGTMELTVLENPRYREGAILSLRTARDHLNEEVLVMDADVLCPQPAFERLVSSRHQNCILVDGTCIDAGEEQMVFGEGNRVFTIAKRPSPQMKARWTCFGEAVGFLKLSKEPAGLLRQLLDRKAEQGVVNIEHEQVYPDLFEKRQVGFEKIDGMPWTEIDTPEDLKRAQEIFRQWKPPHCLNRKISAWFLPWIVRLPVTPNQWTSVSLLLGLGAVAGVAQGSDAAGWVSAALFQLSYMVDNWDGEVARLKGLSSKWGGWFDVIVDAVVQVGLALALAVGLKKQGVPSWVMTVGWIAAGGVALDFGVTFWAKRKGFGPAVFGDPSRGRAVGADSPLGRWIRTNLTNENFSFLVIAALGLGCRLPFLLAIAVGAQIFWIQFLWRERTRLFVLRRTVHPSTQARPEGTRRAQDERRISL